MSKESLEKSIERLTSDIYDITEEIRSLVIDFEDMPKVNEKWLDILLMSGEALTRHIIRKRRQWINIRKTLGG